MAEGRDRYHFDFEQTGEITNRGPLLMKYTAIVAMSLSISGSCAALGGEVDASRLRVLYVGNKDTDRGRAYAKFLGEKFNLVGARDRNSLRPPVGFPCRRRRA